MSAPAISSALLADCVTVAGSQVTVTQPELLATDRMDTVINAAVFGSDEEKEYARWLLWEVGQHVGVRPASIHDLYTARGAGKTGGYMCRR